MKNGLRKEINDVVVKYLKRKLRTGKPIDVAEMADEMAQSSLT
jgi:nucleoid-associated protein YejK